VSTNSVAIVPALYRFSTRHKTESSTETVYEQLGSDEAGILKGSDRMIIDALTVTLRADDTHRVARDGDAPRCQVMAGEIIKARLSIKHT